MSQVYLVGAGPGDPQLLTLKGAQALKKAEVVLYDRLVNPLLLYLAPKSAELVYVGKKPHEHGTIQEEIGEKLLHYGKEKVTVRLKGGDPSIFGRVAEEMAVLENADISYEVVPGITSAVSASIYAGFAVTERLISEKCFICTPTEKLQDFSKEPLGEIAKNGSVVVYMGMEKLEELVTIFLNQGSAKDLPVAIVEWGTWGRQKKAVGTLATITQKVLKKEIHNPALIVLGQSAKKAENISWFEKLPGYNKKIIYVTNEPLDLEKMFTYTSEGTDIYPVLVGEAYDSRFAELHERILKEYENYEMVYVGENAQKDFQTLKEKLFHEG